MTSKTRGTCFHCGCTEENACVLGGGRFGPITCSWLYKNPRLVCSNKECVLKEVDLLWREIEVNQRKAEEIICP